MAISDKNGLAEQDGFSRLSLSSSEEPEMNHLEFGTTAASLSEREESEAGATIAASLPFDRPSVAGAQALDVGGGRSAA
jgi:hypothetical protein